MSEHRHHPSVVNWDQGYSIYIGISKFKADSRGCEKRDRRGKRKRERLNVRAWPSQ